MSALGMLFYSFDVCIYVGYSTMWPSIKEPLGMPRYVAATHLALHCLLITCPFIGTLCINGLILKKQ